MKTKSKIALLLAGAAMSATAVASAYAQNNGQNPPAPRNMQQECQAGQDGAPCGPEQRGMGPRGMGRQAMGERGMGPRDGEFHGKRHGNWDRQMASNEHGHRGPHDGGPRGRGFGAGRGEGPQIMFQRADADNSGSVTLEEFQTLSPLDLASADADSNGMINVDELTDAMLREMVKRRAERVIERFDTDNDGQVSTAEIEAHQQERFASMDIDGSGAIEQDELRLRGGDRDGRGDFRRHHGGRGHN